MLIQYQKPALQNLLPDLFFLLWKLCSEENDWVGYCVYFHTNVCCKWHIFHWQLPFHVRLKVLFFTKAASMPLREITYKSGLYKALWSKLSTSQIMKVNQLALMFVAIFLLQQQYMELSSYGTCLEGVYILENSGITDQWRNLYSFLFLPTEWLFCLF